MGLSTGPTVLIPLSGFLGAGKTTLMLAAADLLRARGLTVACVTNDQGDQLVDSNMVEHRGFLLGEVRGGCFCCRFNELADTLNTIIAVNRPDIILAEAVGSCTDLTATVIRPLKSLYGNLVQVRPLTSLVDPLHLDEEFFSPDQPSGFSPEIRYIIRKQLEDASCLLLNKTDLLLPDKLVQFVRLLQEEFPHALVLHAAVLDGHGVDSWLEHILSDAVMSESAMDIDYDVYADGEAQLGWLNASFTAEGAIDDVVQICQALESNFCYRINSAGARIAHLKLWAQDHANSLKISVVRNAGSLQTDLQANEIWSAKHFTIWINARIQMDYMLLKEQVQLAMEELRHSFNLDVRVHELECFAPSRPVPAYRMA